MPNLRIREIAPTADGFSAELTIETDRRTTYPITIRNPFDPQTEQELEWYFEQWLECPTLDTVQAQRARDSVAVYGRDLFAQVFRSDDDAYADYRELRRSLQLADGSVSIEIEGSPEFQALHWEAMRDEDLSEPLAAIATMVRVNPQKRAGNPAVMSPSGVLNLLIVTARPSGGRDVGYRTISRPLIETIDTNELPVNVELVRPGTWEALDRQLQARGAGYYHAIHFDLHGSVLTYDQAQKLLDRRSTDDSPQTFKRGYGLQELKPFEGAQGFLSFEADRVGTSILVSADEVATKLLDKQIPLCILNACQSAKQLRGTAESPAQETSLGAKLLEAGMQAIVAMAYSVTVDAARVMMTALYRSLFGGASVMEAIRCGRRELLNHKTRTSAWFGKKIDLEDWLLPVVYANGRVDLNLQPLDIEDDLDLLEDEPPACPIQEPSYGFVGRDVDILDIERRLLKPDANVLLLQGMVGVGKTTLLAHLWDWWHKTGLIEGAFYFGYDRRGYTFAQILSEVARSLLSEADWLKFQARNLQIQAKFLTKRLRSTRYVLMLDNLESVTAAALSIPNALPEDERAAIAGWLRSLVGGKTLVVLGSRGREVWLERVYGKKHLSLQGLDPSARLILAEQILEVKVQDADKIAAIQQDQDFKKLMKLLAGYPSAMEMVLEKLAWLSPGKVLAWLSGLDAADVDLDRPDARDKTESILQCIDFSFCGLSEAARNLLVCLAPFSGFIFVGGLEKYAEQLESIAELTPFVGAHGNAPSDNVGAESGGRTAVTPLRERLAGAVQEAIDWGLLSPILPENPGLLSIQPMLPFFLRSKFAGWDEAARSGLRQAFKQHYLHFAHDCYKFINSRELQDQQIGVHACYFQYENLAYCLELFLTNTEENFLDIYACLVSYLKATENRRERLRLSHSVYTYLETKQLEQVTDEFKFNTLTVYDVIASEYTQERKYKEARLAYEKILGFLCDLKIIPNEERQQLIAAKLHCLGGVNLEEREYDNARQRYNEALRIFIQIKDRHSEANTYHQLGILAQTQSISKDDSYFKDALDSYEKAIHIFSELSDLYRLALTLSQEGTLYQNAEIYENAGLNFDKALHIFTLIGAKSDQAKIYRQLGVIEQSQQRMKSARNYYQKALKYFVELEDRYSQSFVYHQIGILSEDMDEPEEAQDNYQKALEIFTEFNDLHSQATTYCALGNVAMSRKNWSESQANHLKALKIWIDFSDEYRVKTYSLSNIQRLYQQTQDETLLTAAANLLGTTPDDLRQIFTPQ